jgi:hypothetical protein
MGRAQSAARRHWRTDLCCSRSTFQTLHLPIARIRWVSSLAEEGIDDGGSHREHARPHDELAPSAPPPMNARSRDPASAEISDRCDGGRRSAIGGADWKLSKPFDADHGYYLPGLVGSMVRRINGPLTASYEAEEPSVCLWADPCCAIGDSSAAEFDIA